MSFADQLRPLVEKVGGSTPAAAICGVTRQSLNGWLRGAGNPNAATQAGALLLLSRAKPVKKSAA
jgi:DNA-binding phage protein